MAHNSNWCRRCDFLLIIAVTRLKDPKLPAHVLQGVELMATLAKHSGKVEDTGGYFGSRLPVIKSIIWNFVENRVFAIPGLQRSSCKQVVTLGLQLSTVISSSVPERAGFDVFKYIDPLIGTASGGNDAR